MRKKLTPKFLDSLPPARAKRYEVRDEVLPGLLIRVSSARKKIWYVFVRDGNKNRRVKIGTYPIMSLSDARETGRGVLRDIQLGKFREANEEATEPAFGEVVRQFIELYAKPRNRSWKSTERVLTKFSDLYHRRIVDIKRADVVKILDVLVASGLGIGANRALAAIRKLFSWCVDRGVIDHSPIAGLKAPAKEVSRDRVLTDAELAACWCAVEQEGFPFGQFLKILILTGQRRGEVAGMRWSEIDFEQAFWTIPADRAKNAAKHVVPLAPLAISILKGLPRFSGSEFVFTTSGKRPISGFGRLKRRLQERIAADNWRMHDFRRTVATHMAGMGVQPHIIEAVLNHRSGIVSGVAAVYNRHAYMNEKREALKRWACAIMGEMRNQVTPGARDKMVNGPGISFERQSSQKYPMMN
jgi:integrase